MNNVSTGIAASAGSRVTVSNSVMAGNNYGIYVDAHSGATRVVVERSAMTGNVYGIFAGSYNPGDIADVSATQNTVTHNITAGIHAFQAASTSATVTADGNTLSENNIGFSLSGSTIYTRGNNTLKFNTNDLFGGTLTALAGQ
jgi:hypothetical protein